MLSEAEVVDRLLCDVDFVRLAISAGNLAVVDRRNGSNYFDEADVKAFEDHLLLIKSTPEMDKVELRSPRDLY